MLLWLELLTPEFGECSNLSHATDKDFDTLSYTNCLRKEFLNGYSKL